MNLVGTSLMTTWMLLVVLGALGAFAHLFALAAIAAICVGDRRAQAALVRT